ncbi:hypothetical protein PYCCODRAFT_1469588 [Trametes coccinea BRFM310]|uniref:Fungal-type protein kinase domain-containing protein n=1 Tax=Trametes coccinea (strain BRFM310) TaxID=1353009 RepID=A0A1Y2IGD6_TRAC3|nr:hypothetical protein PYCCODRAFT_1469588 [Trametes coccinea BRFM310]
MRSKIMLLPFEEFMNMFIPVPPGEPERLSDLCAIDFHTIPTKSRSGMYASMVAALNRSGLLPHDIAVVTSHELNRDGTPSQQKICGGCYPHDAAPNDLTDWTSVELSIECRTTHTEHDPFEDDETGPQSSSDRGEEVLHQITQHAVLVLDNQQRTHFFTFLVLGVMARILRWDRAGLLATHKFDYTKKPEYLARFFSRFGRMSPVQRGHDPTAMRILPGTAEYKHMHARAATPMKAADGTVVREHARAIFEESLSVRPFRGGPIKGAGLWRLTVCDEQRGTRHFLVGNPHTTAAELPGRGTRTYVAIDMEDKDGPFVYLKDTWRIIGVGRLGQEGEILAKLNDDSDGGPVEDVPTLRCHGDVDGQNTVFHVVWRQKHPDRPAETHALQVYRHYRMIVEEVCLPLRRFVTSWELVAFVVHCIAAHGDAYNRKGLLHGDISSGNVLMYPKQVVVVDGKPVEQWSGILIDWEFAKKVKKSETGEMVCQSSGVGTWGFASALALMNPRKRFEVQDDMESFFHLLVYFAVRFLPHNCEHIGAFVNEYFDYEYHASDGVVYGGEPKLSCIRWGCLAMSGFRPLTFYQLPSFADLEDDGAASDSDLIELQVHPINTLFDEFMKRLHAHYALRGFPGPHDVPISPPAPRPPTPEPSASRPYSARHARILARIDAEDAEPYGPLPPPIALPETPLSDEERKKLEEVIKDALAEKAKKEREEKARREREAEAQKKRIERARRATEELAAELADHEKMMVLLTDCLLETKDWLREPGRFVEDQVLAEQRELYLQAAEEYPETDCFEED